MNLLQEFKNYLFSQGTKPSKVTVKNYVADISQFMKWYEAKFDKDFEASQVNPSVINTFKKDFSEKLSASSVERHLSSLRKFFHYLKIEGLTPKDPFEEIRDKSVRESAEIDPFNLKGFKNFLYVYNASHLTIKNYLIDIKQFLRWAEEVLSLSMDNGRLKLEIEARGSKLENQASTFQPQVPTSSIQRLASKDVLSRINSELIDEYKTRLINEGTFSPATINRKLSSLRKYIAWAHEEKLLENYDLGFKNYDTPREGVAREEGLPTARTSFENARLEGALASGLKGARLLDKGEGKPETGPRNYSSFPPIRLLQKITKGINLAVDATLITQLVKIIEKTEYAAWKIKGQPIFTKIKNQKSKIKSSKIGNWKLEIGNLPKAMYAPLEISTKNFSWYKKAWFTLRYKRPKWYKAYHSYAITHYFHFAVLVIFAAGLAFGFYNAFFQVKSPTLAVNPNLPTNPSRILSFQGRLTDNNDNPITTGTNLRFQIYRDSTASGAAILLWQEVQRVNPDVDGIFNSLLGNTSTVCVDPTAVATGTCSIPQSLFSENNALWLGVTVENTSELTPRQPIATVAFAANSETLQGLLPITATASGTTNVVLALNSSGNLVIGGSATPVFQATGGQFTLTGQTLLLSTGTSSNGNIQLAPDGTGRIDLTKPLQNTSISNNISTAVGSVEVDDLFSILATSSGQSALTINQTSTGPLISASASGVAKFTVDNNGNLGIAGSLPLSANYITAPNFVLNTSGQITTGTWQATAIAAIYGGTGQTSYTTGDLLYASNTTTLSKLAVGTASQCLIGGTTPSWSSCSTAALNYWQRNLGALSPTNITDDLLLGTTATSTAQFSVSNIAKNQAVASLSGQLIVMPNNGWGGQVGIGTTTPISPLTIKGSNDSRTLGSELVTNGTFTTCPGTWGFGLGWGCDGIKANHSATSSGNLSQTISIIAGRTYQVTYFYYNSAGSTGGATPYLGGTAGTGFGWDPDFDISGTITTYITAGSSGSSIVFTADAGFSGYIDNVSVKLLSDSYPLATLQNSDGTTAIEMRSGGTGKQNTFIGVNAGQLNLNGTDITAIGSGALAVNLNGVHNSALGRSALGSNTDGQDNSAFGYLALSSNSTGNYNSAFGSSALYNNTASNNTAVGYQAGYSNNIGNNNSFVGYQAGWGNTTGSSNSLFGYQAGYNNAGNYNSIIGYQAGYNNTATGNSFLGYAAGYNNTGNYNAFIGYSAGLSNTTGTNNSFLGLQAGSANTKGSSNSFLGMQAGQANTTGSNNSFVGSLAGNTNIGGGLNTILGYNADVGSGHLINAGAIGANALVNQNDSLVLGSINGVNSATGSAKIGIGTITPNSILHVTGGYGSNALLTINQLNNGDLFTASAGGTTKFTISNTGALTDAAYTNAGGILYTSTTGLIGQTAIGTGTDCLIGGTTPSFSSCAGAAASSIFWTQALGALYPKNSTVDFLIGGQATTSAKFAVLNVNGTGPATATVSGNLIVMPTNGAGGFVGIGTTAPSEKLLIEGGDLMVESGNTAGAEVAIAGRRGRFYYDGNSVWLAASAPKNLIFATSSVTGTGTPTNERMRIDSAGNVGIGTTSPVAPLHINGGYSNNASLIVNNLNSGDLFTASASGATKFTIGNTGAITDSFYNTCTLKTDSTGLFTCGVDNNTGVNWWNQLAGALSPVDTTNDFLLGSTATSTAKFSYTGIQSGNTIASISGQLLVYPNNGYGGNASLSAGLVIGANANPTIQTTKNQLLTIGGDTTGDIQFKPGNSPTSLYLQSTGNVGIGTANPAVKLQVAGGEILLDTNQKIQFANTNVAIKGVSNSLHLTSWANMRFYADTDNAGDEGFEFYGNVAEGATTNAVMVIKDVGKVGINATSPLSTLDVRPNTTDGGTISVASISGKTSFATLILDNSGVGDIFTASASGAPRFRITNQGNVLPGADNTYDLGSSPSARWKNLFLGGGSLHIQCKTTDASCPTSQGLDYSLGINSAGTFGIGANLNSNSTPAFNITQGGNVGIGTTAPGAKLDVAGTTYLQKLFTTGNNIYSAVDPNAADIVIGSNTGTRHDSSIIFWSATTASRIFTQTNSFYLSEYSGDAVTGANVKLNGNGTDTSWIKAGNVGIGTTAPLVNLDVRGSSGTLGIASISGKTSFAALVANNDGVGDLFTASSSGWSRFVIKGNGNVGIGTTTPTALLDIAGSASTSGNLAFNGTGTNNIYMLNNSSLAFLSSVGGTDASATTPSTDIGTFSTSGQSQLPQILTAHRTIIQSTGGTNYIYVLGGNNANVRQSTVYKATVSTSGDITGGFSTTSQGQLPALREGMSVNTVTVGSSSYVYAMGGLNTSGVYSTVYKSTIDTSGNLGAFSTASQGQLPAIRHYHAGVTADVGGTNYVYVLGGSTTEPAGTNVFSTVYKAQIDTSGNIGSWASATSSLPQKLAFETAAVAKIGGTNYIYVLGGTNEASVRQSTVYKATIDTNGDITGGFSTTSQGQLPQVLIQHRAQIIEISGTNYIYVLGGVNASAIVSTVYKATVDTSGNIGAFSTASQGQLPQILESHQANLLTQGGTTYAYVLGGNTGSQQSTVYKATMTGGSAGGAAPVTALTVANTANVGIGTTNPNFHLDVQNSQSATAAAQIWNTAAMAGAAACTSSLCHTALSLKLGTAGSATAPNSGDRYINFATGDGFIIGKILGNGTNAVLSSTGGDYAEWFKKANLNDNLVPGDLVCINSNGEVLKCDNNNSSMLGVISNSYIVLGNDSHEDDPNYVIVGLLGQIKTNVSSESGQVNPGDLLTYSNTPGAAAKAIKAGPVIGRAIDGGTGGRINAYINPTWYDPQVQLTSTGDLNLVDNTVATDSAFTVPHYFSLNDALGNPINRVGAFAQLISADIRAGSARIEELSTKSLAVTADNVSIGGQSLRNYIVSVINDLASQGVPLQGYGEIISPIASINEIHTGLISPLAENSNIAVKLDNSQFSILNSQFATGSAVASIDNQGNATFSGSLTANNLTIQQLNNSGDATISGTLRAGKILATDIVGLNVQASAVSANYITNNYYASSSSDTVSTGSAVTFPTLAATPQQSSNSTIQQYVSISPFASELAYIKDLSAATAMFSQGLMVFGPTTLSDTSIAGQLSVNGSLILADNSINVLGSDLNLQPLRQGGLSIMAGLFYIDTNGNVTIGGNTTIKGTLYSNVISPIPGNDLAINLASDSANGIQNSNFKIQNSGNTDILSVNQLGDLVASGTATFSKLNLGLVAPALAVSPTEVIATGSAGTGTINAGRTQMTINNALVTDKSLIYITPTTSTNQPLFLLRQVPNESFTAGVQNASLTPIQFNWIIVN